MRTNGRELSVEVVYARSDHQTMLCVTLPEGASVDDALERSGILARYPQIDQATAAIGIFGKVVARDRRLADGDRIEIYRPLLADAKASRHARVAKKRTFVDNPRNMRV